MNINAFMLLDEAYGDLFIGRFIHQKLWGFSMNKIQ